MTRASRAALERSHRVRSFVASDPPGAIEARREPRGRAAERADSPAIVGEVLLHPVCLLAMLLWWWNDAFGKPEYPGLVTGKLSDVAALIVFPLFVWSLIGGALRVAPRRWRPTRSRQRLVLDAVLLLTGSLFAAINLSPGLGAFYVRAWQSFYDWVQLALPGRAALLATHTVDPSDLLSLPSLLMARWLGRRQRL